MKFEKFFKSAGTHGLIVKKSDNESWLVCGGVGMKIPDGVNNLGINQDPDQVFKAILSSYSEDDILSLRSAILKDPEGKANDIIRVFETDLGDQIGIYNSDYGLLEKKDRLSYLEIEKEDPDNNGLITLKFMVIRDYDNQVVGFISGADI